MLTIFGKKKKEETNGGKEQTFPTPVPTSAQAPPIQAPIPSPSPGQGARPTPAPPRPADTQSPPQPAMRAAPPQQFFRPPPLAPLPAEETSLTKLLQSLLADIPLPPEMDSSFGTPQSTPDYVPVRSTPPSRPMVIGPGKDVDEWEEPEQQPTKQLAPASAGKPKPTEAQPPASKAPVPAPTPPIMAKKDQPPEKTPEKPSKIEKQPEKPSKELAPKKETRALQSFDHIFQLTQGNLENSGLVIINGEAGSGRTTLCSGLTGNYMKMGNPCLYLTYDQSPSDLRNQMKTLGTDATQYESGFRFIIVDGFASQSDSFSMEPYYLDQAYSFDNIQDTLMRSSQIFIGEKIRIIFDSLDGLAAKLPAKDFTKGFGDLVSKLKDAGATFIVTIDFSKLSKDLAGSLNDLADCVVDLSKDDSDRNGRELKVQRLNHSSAKIEAETFEIDANKGLVFV